MAIKRIYQLKIILMDTEHQFGGGYWSQAAMTSGSYTVPYADLLEKLFDPSDPEHDDMRTWVDSLKGCTFEPEQFYAAQVKFVSPAKRFKE